MDCAMIACFTALSDIRGLVVVAFALVVVTGFVVVGVVVVGVVVVVTPTLAANTVVTVVSSIRLSQAIPLLLMSMRATSP